MLGRSSSKIGHVLDQFAKLRRQLLTMVRFACVSTIRDFAYSLRLEAEQFVLLVSQAGAPRAGARS